MDGDTSTNDCVLGLANGAAGNPIISDPASPEAKLLGEALTVLLQALAKCIAWDGEGATVLIEVGFRVRPQMFLKSSPCGGFRMGAGGR